MYLLVDLIFYVSYMYDDYINRLSAYKSVIIFQLNPKYLSAFMG